MGSSAARWATVDDVGELVRLRRLMFESMGIEVTTADDDAIAAGFAAGIGDGTFFVAVIDGDEPGRLAACGAGMVARRIPGPGNPSGRFGYVQSMVTDEAHRGRGFGRAVLDRLMERFDELGVVKVDLHATAMGAPLYRSVGFAEGSQPELRWSATPRNACQ